MTIHCTWADPPDNKRCSAIAVHPHHSKDGSVWSQLCDHHHEELEKSMDAEPMNIPLMLRNWVRASGGSRVMAKKHKGLL